MRNKSRCFHASRPARGASALTCREAFIMPAGSPPSSPHGGADGPMRSSGCQPGGCPVAGCLILTSKTRRPMVSTRSKILGYQFCPRLRWCIRRAAACMSISMPARGSYAIAAAKLDRASRHAMRHRGPVAALLRKRLHLRRLARCYPHGIQKSRRKARQSRARPQVGPFRLGRPLNRNLTGHEHPNNEHPYRGCSVRS